MIALVGIGVEAAAVGVLVIVPADGLGREAAAVVDAAILTSVDAEIVA